jgi:hypothetical protein
MQTTMRGPAAYSGSALIANLLGLAIAALIAAALTSASPPLLGSDRAILLAVVALGMTMCSVGGVGRAPMKFGWTHPVTLFGIAVGTVMLLIAAAVLIGQVADRTALNVFAVLLAVKWAIGLTFVR